MRVRFNRAQQQAEQDKMTPERILQLARRPDGFRVSWRYRLAGAQRGGSMTHLSPRAIEAGADALRHFEQGGKRLNEWASLPNATKKKWTAKVEAVLTALEAEGMVVVPRIPTDAMCLAGYAVPQHNDGAHCDNQRELARARTAAVYRAMIAAAQGGDDAGQ